MGEKLIDFHRHHVHVPVDHAQIGQPLLRSIRERPESTATTTIDERRKMQEKCQQQWRRQVKGIL